MTVNEATAGLVEVKELLTRHRCPSAARRTLVQDALEADRTAVELTRFGFIRRLRE